MTHKHGATSLRRGPDDVGAGETERAPASDHSMWWMVVCCAPFVLFAVGLVVWLLLAR